MSQQELPDRKTPIHLSPIEKHNRSIIIFLTVCSKNHISIFDNEEFHQLLIKSWNEYNELIWQCGAVIN